MRSFLAFFFASVLIICGCQGQNEPSVDTVIHYRINDNVKNREESYFMEIQNLWENYLNSGAYVRRENQYWDQSSYPYPDMLYVSLLLDINELRQNGGQVQCSTVGIVPVQNQYYMLKAVFTESIPGQSEIVDIKYMITVYAKEIDGQYMLYSSTQYQKETIRSRQVGSVNYIVHPLHEFNALDANRMDSFNIEIAHIFEIEPLQFDYVVANDTRDLSDITGLNLFPYSYQPVPSGGMADNVNNIIYAGNNSEYYPHEVVHLYTRAKFPDRSYHSWFDEGTAALIGGSTGYAIEWHWEKLRRFLSDNSDYKLENLSELQTYIPNGEFITDFRYAIGALICQRIIDKEGMPSLFDAFQAGRSDEDYFRILEQKLGVSRADFGNYIRSEVGSLKPIEEADMNNYRY
ncbi:MAG: hypothetical protein AAGF87_00520 [Bacteroidota bacterium]